MYIQQIFAHLVELNLARCFIWFEFYRSLKLDISSEKIYERFAVSQNLTVNFN